MSGWSNALVARALAKVLVLSTSDRSPFLGPNTPLLFHPGLDG